MNPDDAFQHGPDMTNPDALAQLLLDQAGGLEQQAVASKQGSALGGHPNPAFFYGHSAGVCRAAAAMIKSRLGTGINMVSPGVATAPINAAPVGVPTPAVEPPVTGSLPSGDERAAAKKAKG